MAKWRMVTVGLASRDTTLIETAIDLAYGLSSGPWQMVDQLQDAHVALANADDDAGLTLISDENNNILLVPCSANLASLDGYELAQQTPLSYKAATTLLKDLERRLGNPQRWEAKLTPPSDMKISAETAETAEDSVFIDITRADDALPITASSEAHEAVAAIANDDDDSDDMLLSDAEINVIHSEVDDMHIDADAPEIDALTIAKHKIDWLSDEDEEHDPDDAELLSMSENAGTELGQIAGTQYTPSMRLSGVIQSVIESGKTSLITHPKFPELRVFPENGWFVSDGDLDSATDMYRVEASEFSVADLEDEIKNELFSGRLPQSLWKLIYTSTLFASQGHLLDSLNAEEPMHLKHAPYFGMIPHSADHVAIADYMVENENTPAAISELLDIDLATVIDFCNACAAIDLLRSGKNTLADSQEENEALRMDLESIENEATVESELDRTGSHKKKSGFMNSLLSNISKTTQVLLLLFPFNLF